MKSHIRIIVATLTMVVILGCAMLLLPATKTAAASPQAQWRSSNSRWWYSYGTNSYARDQWLKLDNKWYLFDEDGWMLTGWQRRNGRWYYLGSNGAMYSSRWLYDNGQWYYLASNGAMHSSRWLHDNGRWYYLASNGAMHSSRWLHDNGRWYYLASNGAMYSSRWLYDKEWYFFNEDGSMRTSAWAKSNNKYYYLQNNGEMAKGLQVINDKWYLLGRSGDDEGVMLTGWQVDSGNTYYFAKSGEMLTGWQVIGGKEYFFAESGALIADQREEDLELPSDFTFFREEKGIVTYLKLYKNVQTSDKIVYDKTKKVYVLRRNEIDLKSVAANIDLDEIDDNRKIADETFKEDNTTHTVEMISLVHGKPTYLRIYGYEKNDVLNYKVIDMMTLRDISDQVDLFDGIF